MMTDVGGLAGGGFPPPPPPPADVLRVSRDGQWLARAAGAAETHVAGLGKVKMGTTDSDAPHPLRVLCVDDHPDSLSALERLLKLQRYEVRTCTTASAARAALASDGTDPYDLLIADLTLPDGDGIDLMRQATHLGIPGIALSGRTGQDEHERSRAAGFFAHLDKPVVYDALTAVIQPRHPPLAAPVSPPHPARPVIPGPGRLSPPPRQACSSHAGR